MSLLLITTKNSFRCNQIMHMSNVTISILQRINIKCQTIKHISTVKPSNFKTVYKFPYINGIGLINRLKLYHTVLTCAAIPTATILDQLNVMGSESDYLLFTVTLGFAGIIPLYSLGYLANKLVGIVYLNEEEKLVKIAYLDFWGKRRDVVVGLKEIVPFSEVPRSITDPLYSKVHQFTSKESMKLCTRTGILDPVGFNKIFLT